MRVSFHDLAKLELNELIQVDMAKASDGATLGREVVDEIQRAAELLARIGHWPAADAVLDRFMERFTGRLSTRGPIAR